MMVIIVVVVVVKVVGVIRGPTHVAVSAVDFNKLRTLGTGTN